jgi:hypothetical protein
MERTNYELLEISISSRGKIVLIGITMIITYNEYPCSENLYTEIYCNRTNHLRITKKCIIYVQG